MPSRNIKNSDDDLHNHPAKRGRIFFKILPIAVLLLCTLFLLNNGLHVQSPKDMSRKNSDLTLPGPSPQVIVPPKVAGKPDAPGVVTSYHTQGKAILDNLGQPYTPYGVHSTALFEPDWKDSVDYKNFTLNQMRAARNVWHSNVVAFQVAWTNLFPDHNNLNAPDPAYLQAMDRAVTWANQEQMNVIFNLQSEAATNEIMATSPSINFWQVVANRYKSNQHVFFDLFNEPRDFYNWDLWQSGGVFNGVQYIGMQQLVNVVRATGAENLILVQGQGSGESFDYANFRDHLLNGTNLIYAIHPYFSVDQHLKQQDWEQWWGQSVANLNVPFVIGEWNETSGSGCVPNAPTIIPAFLNYIQRLNIGLIAWGLTPGSLIRSTGNPDDAWNWARPTRFDQSSLVCRDTVNYPDYNPQAQGAGELIMQFFAERG